MKNQIVKSFCSLPAPFYSLKESSWAAPFRARVCESFNNLRSPFYYLKGSSRKTFFSPDASGGVCASFNCQPAPFYSLKGSSRKTFFKATVCEGINLRKYFAIILLLTITALTSCEEDASIAVPESKPKLVIGCFLSPQDTMIRMTVTRSKPLYSDNANFDQRVTDAVVKISNGATNIVLPFEDGGGLNLDYYQLPVDSVFPIVGGATYYLTVSAPGLDAVEANCTIPTLLNDTMTVQINDDDIYNVRCNVKWTDFASQKNYFRVAVQSVLYDSVAQQDVSVYNLQPEGAELVDDVNNDGATFDLTFKNDYLYHPEDHYDVYLMNIDKNYFLYQRSVNDYNYYSDPFSEATPIYTNIKNGLGVFCGYQVLKKRYKP